MAECKFRIGIFGAGISGICAAIQLQLQLKKNDYVMFEEQEEVGGAWFLNTYPGCCCDIPSYFYSYSFEENPNWSQLFSPQQEILQYLKNVAKKYNLYKNIKFSHKVKSFSWDEQACDWKVVVESGGMEIKYVFDIIFPCQGGLNIPNYPEQFEAFKGAKMHTARWDHNIELDGKRVAIVGTGASAVQIIPKIVHKVDTLTLYQRTPPWILPRVQFDIPSWMQWIFAKVPLLQKGVRYILFWVSLVAHQAIVKDSFFGKIGNIFGRFYIWKEFNKGDKTLKEAMVPKYALGGKRPIPSESYFKALNLPNVNILTKNIVKVKEGSIITEDGKEQQIDVLILATGFRVLDYRPTDLICHGINGLDIFNFFQTQGPTSYHGICSYLLPNNFLIIGPNGPPGTTSFVFSIECAVNYSIKVIQEMMVKNCKVVKVKEEDEKIYMGKLLEDLQTMVWSDVPSYYRDNRGVVIALNPRSALSYWKITHTPEFEHFIFS